MSGKNKPKRLDRNRSWRVARRKKKRKFLVEGSSRNRKPRPKKKGVIAKVVEARNSVLSKLGTSKKVPSSSVARNSVPSKLGTSKKVPSSSGKVKGAVKKKVVKKE